MVRSVTTVLFARSSLRAHISPVPAACLRKRQQFHPHLFLAVCLKNFKPTASQMLWPTRVTNLCLKSAGLRITFLRPDLQYALPGVARSMRSAYKGRYSIDGCVFRFAETFSHSICTRSSSRCCLAVHCFWV